MSVWSREKREMQSIDDSHKEALATAERVLLLAQRVMLAVEERKCNQTSPTPPKP